MSSEVLRAGRQGRVALLGLLIVCALSMFVQNAEAHAALDRSDPPANAILAASPTQVVLWFTEPLERSYSKAELYDDQGQLVPGSQWRAGDTDSSMVIDLAAPLQNGTYSVVWRTLSSADGHTAGAYFAFTVGSQTDVTTVTVPADSSSKGPPLWLRSLARWLALLGLAALLAVWPVWLWVIWPSQIDNERQRAEIVLRAKIYLRYAIALAVVGSLVAVLVQAATLPSGTYLSRLSDTLLSTRFGRLWWLRIGLIGLYGLMLSRAPWSAPGKHRWRSGLTLAIALCLPLPYSLNAHAAALQFGRTVAIAIDMLHLLSASLWTGGLLLLLWVLIPPTRKLPRRQQFEIAGIATRRFSALALACWGILILSGLYSAWLQVGNLEGLRSTAYGHSLTVKLIILVPLLLLGAINLLLIGPSLRQNAGTERTTPWVARLGKIVSIEIGCVLIVLLIVGRMTSQQPGRDVLVTRANETVLTVDLDQHPSTLSLSPGVVGPNHYVLNVGGDTLPDGTEAVLRLTLAGQSIGEKEIPLDRAKGNRFETHGSELSIAGTWTVQVLVRQIGAFQYSNSQDVVVAATPPSADIARPAWKYSTKGLIGVGLVVLGIFGCCTAWYVGRSRLRFESAGLGITAMGLGLLLLIQGRSTQSADLIDWTLVNPIPATSNSVTRGAQTFSTLCLSCHGPGGKGDGELAGQFNPPPADFTSPHSQTHVDGEFNAWIKSGKAGTGMPAFGDQLTDEQIWDVMNYLRVQFQGGQLVEATPVATPQTGTPTAN